MRERQHCKVIILLLVLAAISVVALNTAHGQAVSVQENDTIRTPVATICDETAEPSPLKDALRQVCLRKRTAITGPAIRKAIVIGFVGGFVKHDDPKHPEVHFAAYLRDRYPSGLHAEVFANHEGQKALREVLRILDTDGDGALTATEKEQASIIIYGHSWGASQTVTLAQELGRRGIPVLLTIQLDIIAKPGQNGSTIPSNVANAVNFYQPRGLLHGHSEIRAADPARTKILGNFRMTYKDHPINCDNYRWFARTFNKPHHEIENDPRAWDQAASLIDSELSSPRSTAQASSPSKPPLFK
jgi:hypothetical protein